LTSACSAVGTAVGRKDDAGNDSSGSRAGAFQYGGSGGPEGVGRGAGRGGGGSGSGGGGGSSAATSVAIATAASVAASSPAGGRGYGTGRRGWSQLSGPNDINFTWHFAPLPGLFVAFRSAGARQRDPTCLLMDKRELTECPHVVGEDELALRSLSMQGNSIQRLVNLDQ
jgi:hypothetical protein